MDFFISDTHFGHANIIHLAKRPFVSVDQMDSVMIANWNKTVQPTDTVWHLGDFAWKGQGSIFPLLNGNKVLIVGNHDFRVTTSLGWTAIHKYYELDTKVNNEDRKVVLFHYPIYEWNNIYRKALHLFGHVHGKPVQHAPEAFGETPLAFDVGVEKIDYTPVTLDTLLTQNKFKSYTEDELDTADVGC